MKKQRVSKSSPQPPIAVPVPQPSKSFYPFETMAVNTAFIAPRSDENAVRTSASRYKAKLGRTFTVRRLTAREAEDFGKRKGLWVGCWRLS